LLQLVSLLGPAVTLPTGPSQNACHHGCRAGHPVGGRCRL